MPAVKVKPILQTTVPAMERPSDLNIDDLQDYQMKTSVSSTEQLGDLRIERKHRQIGRFSEP